MRYGGEDLKKSLKPGSKLKIAASCFSIYAYAALKRELDKIEKFEFIFTEPTFTANEVTDNIKKEKREFHIPKQQREKDLYGSEFEIQLKNKLTQKAIAKECAVWMRRKAKFRSNSTKAPMQQFAYLKSRDQYAAYMPIHGFTAVDLGYQKSDAVSNFINKVDEVPLSSTYMQLFEQIWNDDSKLEDVTDNLCQHIELVYQENSPEKIYYLMLFHIFNEFLEDINEDVLPNDLTGYQDSVIWQKLFNFQHDAATGIINKLETYNGCILADSVGLGKTFTALAVIKYYELRNRSVLVLCPKKLADNWLNYNRNLKTNILSDDRLNYDVLCHTDLQRTSGESFGTPLNRINWGNYDLVVIDESHNFRNNDAYKDKETRYKKLMNSVIRDGVKTKVLMLSATPVNNHFNDLRNQLALAYEGNSENLSKNLRTSKSIEKIFRQAQTVFNQWSKLPPEDRTAKATLNSLDFDFFELLDSVTIALKENHSTMLEKIKQFKQSGIDFSIHDIADSLDKLEANDDELNDLSDMMTGGKVQVNLADMDLPSWQYELQKDFEVISELLASMVKVKPEDDSKLQHLITQIENKVKEPINPGNKKILVFSTFADTANYLYNNLAPILQTNHGLFSGKVTGKDAPKTNLKKGYDFQSILILFSPVSKEKDLILPNEHGEIDILIGTDCISEGQNLQDCDYLINYDIHWNPVRIIQRFGRVDRIGSQNESIQLVNYWPDISLDEYINLKERVENRMVIADVTATGDDNVLSAKSNDVSYRKEQLRRLQDEVIELEDLKTGVNITDLGLNDFRMDLVNYIKENAELHKIPSGMQAVIPVKPLTESGEELKPGVIFTLRNRNSSVNINQHNRLHPYYLVYIDNQGEIISNHTEVKKLLDLVRSHCRGINKPVLDLCQKFNSETQDGREMNHYSELLGQAIRSMIAVKEEKDIDSLFSGGKTTALVDTISGLDDFELITFLVIQ
jgi:superfamily II DNA or RNA helicase